MTSLSIIETCQDTSVWIDFLKKSNKDCRSGIESMGYLYHIPISKVKDSKRIYILWADGEITEETLPASNHCLSIIQRWIGIRNVKTIFHPIFSKPLFCFPYSKYPYTGCIMSLEECRMFRAFIYRLYVHRSSSFSLNE